MNGSKLKQLIDKNKYSVNELLSGLLPKAKTKHLSTVLANRLNEKGVRNSRGGAYYPTSVQNTLYYINRMDMNILDEVGVYLSENGIDEEQLENLELA